VLLSNPLLELRSGAHPWMRLAERGPVAETG
jgi:hypothetical protein